MHQVPAWVGLRRFKTRVRVPIFQIRTVVRLISAFLGRVLFSGLSTADPDIFLYKITTF
jgi:hypothetical protein